MIPLRVYEYGRRRAGFSAPGGGGGSGAGRSPGRAEALPGERNAPAERALDR